MTPSLPLRRLGLAAVLAGVGATAQPAVVDAEPGLGAPYSVQVKAGTRLSPTVRAGVFTDSERTWSFSGKGYVKVDGRTIARIPDFSGTADPTANSLSLRFPASVRRAARAAGRRSGARRVTLTLVMRGRTTDDGPAFTDRHADDSFLRIPY